MPHISGYVPAVENSLNAQLKRFAILEGNAFVWSDLQREIIEVAQTDALAADVDAQSFLANNRSFIKNTGLATRTIQFNGIPYDLLTATSYCLSPDEAGMFLFRASQLGFTDIVPVDIVEYVATGVVETFFE